MYPQSIATRTGFVISCLMVIAAIQGCGRGNPELGKVSGKATYKGKPVTKGIVNFLPEDKEQRAASGTIGPDGRFNLTTYKPGDGAPLGRHRVSVVSREPGTTVQAGQPKTAQEIMKGSQSPERLGNTPEVKELIPSRYESPDTSGLSFVVKAGSNSYDIELTD